jgi:hypothetical protein
MNGALKLLSEHRAGATLDEINEAIRDATAAVTDQQKAATVTIIIGIKPLGKGDGLAVAVETKSKLPKEVVGTSVFFATVDNDLVREDPRQASLGLREIKPNVSAALAG